MTTSTSTPPCDENVTDCVEPGLHLKGVAFESSFTEVVLTFTNPVSRCNAQACISDAPGVACDSVVSGASAAKLGSSPRCLWSGDYKGFHMLLGEGATLRVGDVVETVGGQLSSGTLEFLADPLSAPVELGQASAAFGAVLTASPPAVYSCGEVFISAAATAGGFGRAMTYAWSLGNQTPQAAQSALQSRISQVGQTGSFVLPAQAVADAIAAVPANDARPLRLEVQVTMTNWLGHTATASASVDIIESQPVWQAAATTNTALSISNNEAAIFAIRTVAPESCNGGAQFDPSAAPPNITWSYRLVGGSGAGWVSLAAASLTDANPEQTVVEFNPFTFAAGTQHQLRAEVGSSSVVFAVDVKQLASPVVEISGPEQVSSACAFQLEASAVDPSVNPETGTPSFSYLWSCVESLTQGSCSSAFNFATSGSILQVPEGSLAVGLYTLSVSVTSLSTKLQTIRTWDLHVSSGASPPMHVTSSWIEGDLLSVQAATSVTVSASLQPNTACTLPATWLWKWAVADLGSRTLVQNLSSLEATPADISTFPAAWLLGGRQYAYALLGANESELAPLQFPIGLDAAAVAGVQVTLSTAFTADTSPSQGVVQVAPLEGTELATSFSVATGGWFKHNPGNVEYAFYRFNMVVGTTTLVTDGQMVCSPECNFPNVDWTDRSSSMYWLNQGGSLIRPWGPAGTVGALTLAPGNYFIVARARTASGAAGTAIVKGPSVASAPSVTVSTARAALAKVALDPNAIIDTVGDLSTKTVSANEEQGLVDLTLGNLETAASSSNIDTQTMQKIGQVVNDIVVNQGAAQDLPDMTRATAILDSVVSGAAFTEQANSAALLDAGDTLLEAVQTIAVKLSTTATGSETDKLALGGKVAGTASGLATKLTNTLGVGQSSTFSSKVGSGSSLSLSLAKDSLASVAGGKSFFGGQVALPANAVGQRRLQSGSGACSQVDFQSIDWVNCNIYQSVSSSFVVPSNADLKGVVISECGAVAQLTSAVQFNLTMPTWPSSPGTYEASCVRYDDSLATWSADGVSVDGAPPTQSSTTVSCNSTHGNGTYTVGFTLAAPPGGPTPSNPNDPGDSAASAGIAVGIVIGLVALALCAAGACLALGLFYRRTHSKAKRQEEEDAAMDVNEAEHEGVGEMPAVNNLTVKQPAVDELDMVDEVIEPQSSVHVDIFDHAEEEEMEGNGMFMDVGRDTGARRRFAL